MIELLSVVVPCYNEVAFIDACLRSLLATPDFGAASLEVLVVDGGSTDSTLDRLAALSAEFPVIRVINNPKRISAAAVNLGIAASRGDVVVRIDAHCRYPPGYLLLLVTALEKHGADGVGGVIDTQPRVPSPMGTAQARVLSHPLAVGNAYSRTGTSEVREADTILFGCWRRQVLAAAGPLDETLTRSQDFEFSRRLRDAGARLLVIPDIVVTYYARSGLAETFRYNLSNGYWVTFPSITNGVRFGARHYAPFAAAVAAFLLLGLGLLGITWLPLAGAVLGYGIVTIAVTVALRPRPGEPLLLYACIPVALVALHAAYGLGSLWGAGAGLTAQVRRRLV